MGTFGLGNAGPNMTAFAESRGAAYELWKILDNVSNQQILPI